MNKKSKLFPKTLQSSNELIPMTYLCRFYQRNRLIEIPITSEYYHQQNRITHEHLKQLIIQEFRLQEIIKSTLIIQIWNEEYHEYIDIESFKKIPFQARLQVLIENNGNFHEDSSSLSLKCPSTPISTTTCSITSNDEIDSLSQITIKIENTTDEMIDNFSPYQHNVLYDLLPKPIDGIPIPHFPPHIVAFLNGYGDANQLNALVQTLYQEIVRYELYPNTDELRSIVNRLIKQYPYSLSVIGNTELLVRKLYYKFCNERKKYPSEFKRRQPNKRKRLVNQKNFHRSSLNHPMHLWTRTNDYTEDKSSLSNDQNDIQTYSPLNLSISTNNNHLLSIE